MNSVSPVLLSAAVTMLALCHINLTHADDGTHAKRTVRQVTEDPIVQIDASTFIQRIVGGSPTQPGSWPYLVRLDANGALCGGTLISPNYVVTAAHCIKSRALSNPRLITVYYGSREMSGWGGKSCRAKDVTMHPNWNLRTMSHDVAILELDCTVGYNSNVQAIALPKATDSLRNTNNAAVLVAGWGTIREGGSVSSVSQYANLATVSVSTCSQSYGRLDTSQMCAMASGKDTCQGDSGGPLVTYDTARNGYVLYGITSFGNGCARDGVPGVYAHVPTVIAWIRTTARLGGDSSSISPTTNPGSSSGSSGSNDGCEVETGSNHQYKLFNVGKDKLISVAVSFRSTGSNTYAIMHAAENKYVVTMRPAEGNKEGNGERAVFMKDTGAANQRFSIIDGPGDTCHVRVVDGGFYLDMGSGNGLCGDSVCQWETDGSQTQNWQLFEQSGQRSSVGNGDSDVTDAILPSAQTDTNCGITDTGRKTTYSLINKVQGVKLRNIYLTKTSGGDFVIHAGNRSGVLTQASKDSENGARLSFARNSRGTNQQFEDLKVNPADGKYCTITVMHSQLNLDLGSGTGACGTSVCQWKSDGSETQLWLFDKQ